MSELMALHDEELFFQIVQQTPDLIEAMDMCRRSVHAVRRVQFQALSDKDTDVSNNCARTVERLRNEITYLGQIYDRTNYRKAIFNLYGAEVQQEVELWLVQNEDFQKRQDIAREAGRNSQLPLSKLGDLQ